MPAENETSEFPVGHATRYPTIQNIPITLHMGGHRADGAPNKPVSMEESEKPQIHMNAGAVLALKDLIVWKECG